SCARLGIITNGSPDMQWRKLVICGLDAYFQPETLIISAEIGAAKPHPSVYQAACERLCTQPNKAVMIGDNYRADVDGARRCGLEALWYCPDPQIYDAQAGEARQDESPLTRAEEVIEALARLGIG
ncbi:MAG: HAD-IA family hydrolase, partial [Alicyclobacillus herbarius]|uniref:HAD family hydrolase n=1 Tax=Alicyclobacillus herbarius TaxID=122960 RepID=UPI00235790D0